ncbi:MAG: YhjD/YihY/BrkB family envelope integrity protein [Kiritimatiellia bacterium]|jgi:membrane protein|nr:YhjD/YihY/BrkB family envelope integrity protein [Kiritimatiellia bacterium]MDP6848291.1 YhjD/YihY/BrkB family envelope integrity protein [Kiritimatiellia bacterium]
MRGIGKKLKRAHRFAQSDVWDIELSSLSKIRRFGVKSLRILHLVFRGFLEDECPLHAAALTFSTIMAIVPIMALSLALARGFGNETAAKETIRDAVSDWTSTFRAAPALTVGGVSNVTANVGAIPLDDAVEGGAEGQSSQLAQEIEGLLDEAFEKVENISFAALGGVGLVLLLWMVVMVLGRVEASFNRVWGVKSGRPIWRKFTDYLSAVLILPFLLVLATSLPVVDFATRFLDDGAADVVRAFMGSGFLKNLMVIFMSSLTFTFIIMFMPNTKVRPYAGITGGVVASILFLVWLSLCAALQVGVARYGKIYGSFAVFPILLAWVYVSWEIVLFAAEVAFAVQNASTYRMEQGVEQASVESKITLALSVVVAAGRGMLGEGGRFEVAAYAREKLVPVRFLNAIVSQLVEIGLLGELSEQPGAFVLMRSPGSIRVGEVVDDVLRHGVQPGELGLKAVDRIVHNTVDQAHKSMSESLSDLTIEAIIKGKDPA